VNDLTLYHQFRDQMQTGDILGWSGEGIISNIIKWKTDGNISHSSMIIRLKEYEGDDMRIFQTEALANGVYPDILSRRLQDYEGHVYWYQLKDEWNDKRIEIGRRLTDMWGTGYDYLSLFKQLIGKANTNARKLFCSETCWIALGMGGKVPNPVELSKMDLYKAMRVIL
jgi:hypothetical protein